MKLEFGNGNIFVTTYGDKDVNYGVAFRIVPENHAINESDPSVVGKTFEEVPHDLYFDFTKSESVQVVIDKLVMVRDDLRAVEVEKHIESTRKKGVPCKYCEILVEYGDMKPWRKDDDTVDMLCPGCDCVLVEGE